MGRRLHHAMVVSAEIPEHLERAHEIGVRIFGKLISPIIDSMCNGVVSFYIPPDGSKEGWAGSNTGNDRRDEFIEELKRLKREHIWTQWIEVEFGDDIGEGGPLVTRSSEDD